MLIPKVKTFCCLNDLSIQVDRSWKELMRKVEDHPNALRSATAPGVFETLQSCNTHLEKIHKSLEVEAITALYEVCFCINGFLCFRITLK